MEIMQKYTEMNFLRALNYLKMCPKCMSKNISLKPIGIPYSKIKHEYDEKLPKSWNKYLMSLPTYKEALEQAETIHLLCEKCNYARVLRNSSLKELFFKDNLEVPMNKMLFHKILNELQENV